MDSQRLTVTGASSLTGRALLPAARAAGWRTTALTRTATDLPAHESIIDWLNAPAALEAIRAADVVVHLAGEFAARKTAAYQEANVATTRRVALGLQDGRAQRVIFISYPGARADHHNPFLASKGQAEDLLLGAGTPAVIFRLQSIVHPLDQPGGFEEAMLQTKPGAKVRMLGDGKQTMAPVTQDTVVQAILAAAAGAGADGVHALAGPRRMSADELIRALNGNPDVPISHTPPWMARALSRVVPDLPPAMVDLYLNPADPGDGSYAAKAFGITLGDPVDTWDRSRPVTA